MNSHGPLKVILDTDIGTDIDDAVCLAYLLSQARCDLIGITTVTGQAVRRASIASAICRVAGRDIPIFPGAESPLIVPQRQNTARQAEGLERWAHEAHFPDNGATEFLRSTIREHPGEIILLAIGPFTNVGTLFVTDPEIPRLLKGLVLMGGKFSDRLEGEYGPTEWNASGDPHATAIVYQAPVKVHRTVGLDVTTKLSMGEEQFRTTFAPYRIFEPVLDFAQVWFRERRGVTFHDPLAAVTIFDEAVCVFDRGLVTIDLSEGPSLGKTSWTSDSRSGPHEIGVEVLPERFFSHFVSEFQQ